MSFHYRSRGFVLKKTDTGESDRLFTLFTKDFGRTEMLGRAARKPKSKLKSSLGTLYLSEVEFVQGKTQKTLVDSLVVENFGNIRNDLDKLETAFKISGLAAEAIQGEERDEKIWALLEEVFGALNGGKIGSENPPDVKKRKLEIIYCYFAWNLSLILGYGIDLRRCVACGEELAPDHLFFNFREGGVSCQRCSGKSGKERKISVGTLKALRIILENKIDAALRLKNEDFWQEPLREISEDYLADHLRKS